MGQLSRVARWGRGAAALARATSRAAGGRQTWLALARGTSVTLKSFAKAAQALFLEVTGVFFVLFVMVGLAATWRAYIAWSAGKIGPGKLVLAVFFTGLFSYFAVTSFWRSRRRQ